MVDEFTKIVLPNYTYFKIHDPAVHYDTDTEKYHNSLVKKAN